MGSASIPSSALIPVDTASLASQGVDAFTTDIRRIVHSSRFEVFESEGGIRLGGQDNTHHTLDPYLPEVLERFLGITDQADIGAFRQRRDLYDLCLEDSWSGYFLAEQLQTLPTDPDLVLIHLDDHTDMMSTVLEVTESGLRDPAMCARFDPASPADWKMAISSGAVVIGSFITPFFYLNRRLHVRHVSNKGDAAQTDSIVRQTNHHDIFPDMGFAGIAHGKNARNDDMAGSYKAGISSEDVLRDLPEGRVFVHIDLDYFINDFNGNSHSGYVLPRPELNEQALHKITAFFDVMARLDRPVDRWIIGCSPGFCSAYHWAWLLSEIEMGIAGLPRISTQRAGIDDPR